MNFTHLKNAVTAAECGSINRAAAELFISQPCLSNSIRTLEKEIGFPIFQRSQNGIRLTPKGKEFIRISSDILKGYEKLMALSDEQDARPLAISAYPLSYLSDSFLRFQKKSSAEPLARRSASDSLHECGNFQVFEDIAAGKSRLGFVFFSYWLQERIHELTESYHCRCEKLFAPVRMYAVAAQDHPIAKQEKICFEKLLQYPFVYFSDRSTQSFFQNSGYQLAPSSLCVQDRRLLFDALRSGEYVSVMTVTKRSRSNDLVYLPIEEAALDMGIYCIMQKVYRPDSRERAFLRFLKQDIQLL